MPSLISASTFTIVIIAMSIGSQGHPVAHTQSQPIKNNSSHYSGQHVNISGAREVVRTRDSMCLRQKSDSVVLENNSSSSASGTCSYGCYSCAQTCVSHGYNFFCCDGGWCCCYKNSGPCQQPGAACTYTYC